MTTDQNLINEEYAKHLIKEIKYYVKELEQELKGKNSIDKRGSD